VRGPPRILLLPPRKRRAPPISARPSPHSPRWG
jgi:hypothetical protein